MNIIGAPIGRRQPSPAFSFCLFANVQFHCLVFMVRCVGLAKTSTPLIAMSDTGAEGSGLPCKCIINH